MNLLLLTSFGGFIYLILLRTRFNNLAQDLVKIFKPLLGKYNTYAVKVLKTS